MKKFIIALIFIAGTVGYANAQTKQKTTPKKATAQTTALKAKSTAATETHAHVVKKKETKVVEKQVIASHAKSDGTPDRRFKENKTKTSTVHLKKDGTPDKRYKVNKG